MMAERQLAFDRLRQLRWAAERRGLANVREVGSDAEFQRLLDASGNRLIVVDFSVDWCPPSIMMEPVMANLSEKYPETLFLKVDVEICTQTADLYEIEAYPTFLFIKNKKQLQEHEGASQDATRVLLELCITGLSEFPDSCITTRSLQHLESTENVSIKDEIAPIWLELAIFIKVDQNVISAITSEYTEPLQCSKALLDYWIDLENDVPKPPTWRVLLDALRSNGKADLATKIEQCKEREPKMFDEIEHYLSKKALKEKYEQTLNKLGQKMQSCNKRSVELKKVIEQKDTEIASLKKQVSTLKAQAHKEDTQSLVPVSQGCDISGVEPVGGITYTVSSLPNVFKWKGYGVRLRIPAGAVAPDVLPMKLQLTASLRGQFEFPEGYEPVSGVYCISLPLEELAESGTLDIQHCMEITHAHQCSSLSFASCSQRSPPYKFELVEGGIFQPRNPYGSMKTTHFSLWGVLRRVFSRKQIDAESEKQPVTATPTEPTTNYSANLFCLQNPGVYSWTLHFVIIQNLEISITAMQEEFKTARQLAKNVIVIYEDDKITLSIPMDGVKKGSWSLLPISFPMIKRIEADRYPSSPVIPNCQIDMKWEDCQRKPEKLKHLVHLEGAEEPRNCINIIFEPDEQVLYSPTSSQPEATSESSPTHPATMCYARTHTHESHTAPIQSQHSRHGLDSEPELPVLLNVVAAKIPSKWKDIGLQLGVDQGVLDGIAATSPGDTNHCYIKVFTRWKDQNSPTHPYAWSTLVNALEALAVGENRLADEIRNNLTGHPSQ